MITSEEATKELDKRKAVAELDRRKQAEQEPAKEYGYGLSRDPEKGLLLDLDELKQGVSGSPEAETTWIDKSIVGGGLNMVEGIATVIPDIAAYFGSEKGKEISEKIRMNVPNLPEGTTAEEVGKALVQYGIPAAKVMQVFSKIAVGVPSAIRWLGTALSGGLTDAVVATSGDSTLADIIPFDSPTKISKTDTEFEKRVKIGTEGVVFGSIADGMVTLGKSLWTAVRPNSSVHAAVSRALYESALDPDAAIKEIDTYLKDNKSIVDMTSGTASGDLGLLGLEIKTSGAADSAAVFTARRQQNLMAISDALESVVKKKGGNPEKARLMFRKHFNDIIDTGAKNVEAAEFALKTNKLETENIINEFAGSHPVSGQEGASNVLDATVLEQLQDLTKVKNSKFGAIDPNGSLVIDDKEPWRELLREVTRKGSELDITAKDLPQDIIVAFKKVLSKPKKVDSGILGAGGKPILKEAKEIPLTFKALMDIRPKLVAAIGKARADGAGHVVERLMPLKNAIDGFPEEIAESFKNTPQGARAAEAVRFFKEEFVPKFGESVGKKFRAGVAKGDPFAGSVTGRKFLNNPSGASESSLQLRSIIEEADNSADALLAVREHVLGDVATLIRGSKNATALTKLKAYISKRQVHESLQHFPSIKKEIDGLINNLSGNTKVTNDLIDRLEMAKNSKAKTDKATQLSATKHFVHNDPSKATAKVLSSGDPRKAMMELVLLAKKDKTGDAIKGLRVAVDNHLHNGLTGTVSIKGKLEVAHTKLVALLDNKSLSEAIRPLYSTDDWKLLKQMRGEMDKLSPKGVKSAGESAAKPLEEQVQRARILLASMYGIVKGKGIFTISRWISNAVGANPIPKVEKLLEDAYLHPDLMKMLLSEHKTKLSQKKAALKIKRYLVNNFHQEEEPRR